MLLHTEEREGVSNSNTGKDLSVPSLKKVWVCCQKLSFSLKECFSETGSLEVLWFGFYNSSVTGLNCFYCTVEEIHIQKCVEFGGCGNGSVGKMLAAQASGTAFNF